MIAKSVVKLCTLGPESLRLGVDLESLVVNVVHSNEVEACKCPSSCYLRITDSGNSTTAGACKSAVSVSKYNSDAYLARWYSLCIILWYLFGP